MKNLSLSVCAAAAFALALGVSSPSVAAPRIAPLAASASSNLIQVQDMRRDRMERRERMRRDCDFRRNRFERRRGSYFYNGHRGYRDRRAGYRLYNGWWFPPAAFGVYLAPRPAVRSGWRAHVRWSHNRWRSYRTSDNTYQSNNGPRRICVSPYRA